MYLETPKLIRKLTILQEGCSIKVTGIPRVEFKSGYAIGDIVLDAKTLERNKRKLEVPEENEKTEHGCGTGLDGTHYCGEDCSGHVYLCDKCEKKLDGYLKDVGITNTDTSIKTKITEDIIDKSCGADSPQEIPNDQD